MTQLQFNNALIGLRDKLHYYAISLTSDSERAEDLLQETFLKALTYRDKFTQNTNFRAWVYTIMKNTFINDYRRNVKTKNISYSPDGNSHLLSLKDKVYPEPDSLYRTKEIHKNINELEEGLKVPFTMFLDGYKYNEIAEELDLPLGTVKSRIFFTRKKLGKLLNGYSNNVA